MTYIDPNEFVLIWGCMSSSVCRNMDTPTGMVQKIDHQLSHYHCYCFFFKYRISLVSGGSNVFLSCTDTCWSPHYQRLSGHLSFTSSEWIGDVQRFHGHKREIPIFRGWNPHFSLQKCVQSPVQLRLQVPPAKETTSTVSALITVISGLVIFGRFWAAKHQ